MPIPKEHQYRFIYHFTHLDNLRGIIQNGVLAINEQKAKNITHRSIALSGIQERRSTMAVICGPRGVVHDYVPFYFCARSSMLLSVLNAKNVDQPSLIYLALPINVLERDDVVFTNASANTLIPPEFFSDPLRLRDLNWAAIDSKAWSLKSEQDNQARMAEVLIHRRVEISMVDHIIVWNQNIKEIVEKIFSEAGLPQITIEFEGYNNKHHYFTQFYANSRQSIVCGPKATKARYIKSVSRILEIGQNKSKARFRDLEELLIALRNDFGCLPETDELIGLESENEVHKENVDAHTLSVVEELRNSEEFVELEEEDKRLVELAAFLHDIGKGPKSRWSRYNGKQQVDPDHPIKSAEMLVRILTEEVAEIEQRSIQVLVKLVCYHDLVGDILGKGRNSQQLVDIAHSEGEIDMLIALGLADMRAVNSSWYNKYRDNVPSLRDYAKSNLKTASVEKKE